MLPSQTCSSSGGYYPIEAFRPRALHPSGAGTETAFRCAFAMLLAAALAVSSAWAKPAGSPGAKSAATSGSTQAAGPRVDSAALHRLYLDGEFDAAIAILEENLKETRQYSRADSAFIFKHLGVMYAAHYDTREKGKYYMHRLLLVEPTAKIMDMYASDMIYMIFKNIREEYEQSRMARPPQRREEPSEAHRMDPNAERERPDAPDRRASVSPATGHGKTWLWAGVAAVTVAAGVGAYVLMNDEPPETTVNEVQF